MKKLLSVLLMCAMILSLGICVSAETTESGESVNGNAEVLTVPKGDRLTTKDLDGKDENGFYTAVIEANAKGSSTVEAYNDYSGYLKLAHDGSYLYLLAYSDYFSTNRTTIEMHVYVDFGAETLYQIVALPNFGPFGNTSNNCVYEIGASSNYNSGSEYGYRLGVFTEQVTKNGVKTLDPLSYNIVAALDRDAATTNGKNCWARYEIVIPMPEAVKANLGKADGMAEIQAGFTYMLGGNSDNYITSGDAPSETPSNWRAWANSGATNAAKNVVLTGTTTQTAVDVVAEQTTKIGEAGTTYSIRFVATLNTCDLANENIGFRFIGNQTVDQPCTTVYSSVLADNKTVPAWWYGADYLYCVNLTDLVVGQEYHIQLATYYTNADGEKDVGTVYDVTIAADGKVTTVPFAS